MTLDDDRRKLARHIVAGLAGWHQFQIAQNLGGLFGEDTARFVIAQIINAQGRYQCHTSQCPKDWPSEDRYRVDFALMGKSSGAKGWYGAIEVKWPGTKHNPPDVRSDLIQDIVRLTVVGDCPNLGAKFLVLGGEASVLEKVFGIYSTKPIKAFQSLLPRSGVGVTQSTTFGELLAHFKNAQERIPKHLQVAAQNKIETTLLAKAEATLAEDVKGKVYVWQCGKPRGKPKA